MPLTALLFLIVSSKENAAQLESVKLEIYESRKFSLSYAVAGGKKFHFPLFQYTIPSVILHYTNLHNDIILQIVGKYS